MTFSYQTSIRVNPGAFGGGGATAVSRSIWLFLYIILLIEGPSGGRIRSPLHASTIKSYFTVVFTRHNAFIDTFRLLPSLKLIMR